MFRILKNQSRMTYMEAEKKFPNCFIVMSDYDGEFTGVPVAISEENETFRQLCAYRDKLDTEHRTLLAGDYGGDVVSVE